MRLQAELRAGSFRFGLLEHVEREGDTQIELCTARDAVVLKALALVLGPLLPISRSCVHVEGHGGAKSAPRQPAARLRRLPFVLRTDVRGEYASIDPVKLVERLARHVPDPEILRLVAALTARTSTRGRLLPVRSGRKCGVGGAGPGPGSRA